MPVIPHGVPAFKVRPPSTTRDDGAPSKSLVKDVDRVFDLIEDERHLTAEKLLASVKQRIAAWENQASIAPSPKKHKKGIFNAVSKKENEDYVVKEKKAAEMEQLKAFLQSKHAVVKKLENRCRLFRKAQHNLNDVNDWTLASKHFGVTTYYRREEDGSLSLKLEGELKDASLFEQVCVLKEIDLHYKWSPFCSSSLTIADLDKLDLVGWFLIGLPKFGLARDGCFRAIGCDNTLEDGSILLAGQGIKDIMPNGFPPEDTFLSGDPIIEKLDIPPAPTRLGSGRMTIRKFEAVLHITSPTSLQTRLVANVDPNISFLPNSLLEFIMKQLAGVVLAKMQNASKKAALHPVTNVHAIKMREEREFYQKWLVAKFQGICESKGWEMPPVAALQLSDQDLQRADHLKSHRMSRAQTFAGDSPAERVVENLPEVSQSARFGTEITDSMSELSNETGKNSIWNNNPISTYLRETELKVQRRKEEEIAVVRRLAAKRLQPKELPSAQRARLAELRKARGRRLDSSTCTQLSVVDEQLEGASKWHWFARQLYSHEPRTRVVVVLSLLCILSIMLHPEFLLRYLPVEFGPRAPRRLQIVEDICVVIYIFVCAVPFFLLCDVALVYAFGALDLGSKAGRQLKTYYSENVRLGVGVGCLGIVGASVLKAVLRVWVRGILWFASRVYTFLRIEVLARLWSLLIGLLLQVIPEEIRSTCITYVSTLTKLTTHVISTSVWAAVVSVKLIWHILFQSNFVGNEVGRVLWACMAGLSSIARRASDFFEESIEVVEGKATVVAWRTEAFHTARSLFLHTAVFLLSALFLFNLSARKSRPASTFVIESKSSSTQQGANEPMKSNVSSMSGTSASFGPNQSPALQHSRTERNAAISEDAVLDGTDALRMPITHESSEGSRRRRFRLRDKRSFTSTSSLSVVSKQPTKLEYAVSC